MKRQLTFLILLIILIGTGIVILPRLPKKSAILPEITACNKLENRLRFSCYKSSIVNSYQGKPDAFVNDIKKFADQYENDIFQVANKDNISYAVFGTNCHTFYHAVGDSIAETVSEGDLTAQIAACPTSCTSACMMGLFKRTALNNNYDVEFLKQLYPSCRASEKHSCAHEIGHILQDKYFYSILKVLDDQTQKTYGIAPKKPYNYITFGKTDFNAPFEACKQLVPEKELPYCYTGIGHNLFLFSEFNEGGYTSMFKECDTVNPENKDNCYGFLIYRIGIQEAAPRFLSGKPDEGNKVCEQVASLINRPNLKHHCYLGVGGGIGLFIDSEYLNRSITKNSLQKVENAVIPRAKLCDKSTPAYVDKCYLGLMGTRFKLFYQISETVIEGIEKIKSQIDDDFQVVG